MLTPAAAPQQPPPSTARSAVPSPPAHRRPLPEAHTERPKSSGLSLLLVMTTEVVGMVAAIAALLPGDSTTGLAIATALLLAGIAGAVLSVLRLMRD